MTYNLTGLATNTTSFLAFSRGVNDNLVGGWLFTMLLFGLMIIMLISFFLGTGDVKRSLLSTSFIGFVLALGLKGLDLVPALTLFVTLIIWAAGIALSWKGD